MIPDKWQDWVFALLASALTGMAGFWAKGGFKAKEQEEESKRIDGIDRLIQAIERGAGFVSDKNKELTEVIEKIVADHKKEMERIHEEYQMSVKLLEEKFHLKSAEYTATIENLELEKRILEKQYATKCLEYDTLYQEHEKLKSETGATVRKINGRSS